MEEPEEQTFDVEEVVCVAIKATSELLRIEAAAAAKREAQLRGLVQAEAEKWGFVSHTGFTLGPGNRITFLNPKRTPPEEQKE